MTGVVLVVDDLEPNVKLLEAKLLNEYYTVLTANSGQKALDILEKEKVDVVLLDVMMPEMDGFETCKKIKLNPKTTHIPVVMVTALFDIEDRVKGLENGADEFLTKPVDDTALLARVKSLSRVKNIMDELQLRNQVNLEFGGSEIKLDNNFTNSKIVIIDDDVVQSRNIGKVLETITPNINIIRDPNISEQEIIDLDPCVVIISCQLEGHDALRICMKLRSKQELKHTPLVMMAEEDGIEGVIKGLELGVNDYFIYPVDENELLARTRTQLRRKTYQDMLRHGLEKSLEMSVKDGLTGLYNRHYLDKHLQQMIHKINDNRLPLCLVMLDIDHFKKLNDTDGHQAGDAILKKLSSILENQIRITDLAARYGGEEFTIILYGISLAEAIDVAERIRQKIEETNFQINDNEFRHQTISIGIAEYVQGMSPEELISTADKALYKAKEQGRNCVISNPGPHF